MVLHARESAPLQARNSLVRGLWGYLPAPLTVHCLLLGQLFGTGTTLVEPVYFGVAFFRATAPSVTKWTKVLYVN